MPNSGIDPRFPSAEVEVKTIATMADILKSSFWELLRLVSIAQKDDDADLVKRPQLQQLLSSEISARLRWAAKATQSDADGATVSKSDTVRYALFVVAGLISAGQSQVGQKHACKAIFFFVVFQYFLSFKHLQIIWVGLIASLLKYIDQFRIVAKTPRTTCAYRQQ